MMVLYGSRGQVLSDPKRRSFYDSTGCVDQEELDGFMRPEDLFAAFFGGGMAQDLDDEEQAMLDEFLKFSGGFSFKAGFKWLHMAFQSTLS